MIPQKSWQYDDLVLKKQYFILNIIHIEINNANIYIYKYQYTSYFCANHDLFFHDSLMNKKFQRTVFI